MLCLTLKASEKKNNIVLHCFTWNIEEIRRTKRKKIKQIEEDKRRIKKIVHVFGRVRVCV